MIPTKKILKLLDRRRKAGELVNSLDDMVIDWFHKNGIPYKDPETDSFLASSIFLVTEPFVLEKICINIINNFNKEKI